MENDQRRSSPLSGVTTNVGGQLAKRALTGFVAGAVGAWPIFLITGLLLGFFLIVIVIVVSIMPGSGGSAGVIPPVEGAPPIGDGTGLVDNYCESVKMPPNGVCSNQLKIIFEQAGFWAKIPAAVIAGVASIEGAQIFGYTDDQIRQYSSDSGGSGIDGQGIDPANSTPNGCSAIGPMQMLIDFDNNYPSFTINCGSVTNPPNVWGEYKTAVNLAGVSTLTNPDARNIRNAIFGAAWKLKCGSGAPDCRSAVFDRYDYDDGDNKWEGPAGEQGEEDGTEGEVYRAARAYLGDCEASGVTYCLNVWEYYLANANFGASGGNWGWPTSGEITQLAHCEITDPDGCYSHKEKSALDIAKSGTVQVYATQDGQAFKLNEPGGCGIYVIIFGSKYDSFYCHLASYSTCLDALPNNSFVKAGTFLGLMGSTGDSTGQHLHYAIKYKGGGFVPLQEFNTLVPAYEKGQQINSSYSGTSCPGAQ